MLNLCKKVTGSFWKKKPGNKLLGQNVTGNKVLSFRFLGLFPKIIRGLPIKSEEIRSQELES